MLSFRERGSVPNTRSLREVCYQPAERNRNKTCITALPFGAVLTISSTSGQCPIVPCSFSTGALLQRLYSIPLSKGKNSPGFFSPETTGTAGIAQKLNCIWYKITSVALLPTYYFQDLLSSLSFQCSWGTTNLTRFFLQITTLWVESIRLNFSHLQQR